LNANTLILARHLKHIGVTQSITRNDYAVYERRWGSYHHNQHLKGHADMIFNLRKLDLRLFFNQQVNTFLHER
jgi:putative hemin transport protein